MQNFKMPVDGLLDLNDSLLKLFFMLFLVVTGLLIEPVVLKEDFGVLVIFSY